MAREDQHERTKDEQFRSASAFAKKHGFEEGGYRHHENGTRGYSIENAKVYGPLLGVTWEYLMEGSDYEKRVKATPPPPPPQPAIPEINTQAMPMNLPVMGHGSCGEDGLFEFNGQVLDYTRRPPRLMGVKDAYAIWIDGDSMVPWKVHGKTVPVHPHMPLQVMDYVVVQLKPTGQDHQRPAYVKQLVKRTATTLVLRQFNPSKDITIPLSKVLSIHRIMEWDEAMGI